ncbi:hypothetical protein BJY01DRAFT_260218 [Aspergillus pseudoustus]|uniref:Altered inheritance of mitochondria protein 6 n=1 Tax=Aspergillus pseudoustus TaxID=1810923 RepID=A0ABR4IY08_9EURO
MAAASPWLAFSGSGMGFFQMLSILLRGLIYLFPDDLDARLDAWVFPGREASPSSYWVTHHANPVGCHSHNDYTRPVPLYSAIKAGCVSVEADIWLSEGDLLVGHNRFTLHPAVTLRSLYLDPLLDILEKHNTRSSSLQPVQSDGRNLAGVFANNPSQTLVLLIDFKTGEHSTLRCLLEQLAPLRERGYLTRFNGVDVLHRPVTVVASGVAPFQDIIANSTITDIFLDAPLDKLEGVQSCSRGEEKECVRNLTSSILYNYTNSYYASTDFRETVGKLSRNSFSQEQLAYVRGQVAVAHEVGLKVRYWGTPTWPRGLRNHVWHVLAREQVDLINVDDLTEGAMQDWRKHRSWFL